MNEAQIVSILIHLQLLSCVLWFQKETSAVNMALSICGWLFFRVQLSMLNGVWP